MNEPRGRLRARGKRWARFPLGALGLLTRERAPGIYFLLYHRVTGDLPLQMDLPWMLFQRQVRYLHERRAVLAYEDAVALLQRGLAPPADRYVFTFDDGFDDLYYRAFPLFRELGLPFTAFVTAAFVEEGRPCVFTTPPSIATPPLSWDMLEEMLASGLFTLGAHGYEHRELPSCDAQTRAEELDRPLELFQRRLGIHPRHFAYPRARWDQTSEEEVRRRYQSAVVAGWSKARPGGFNPQRIPRVPMMRRDGWLFFRAKVHGLLEGERWLYP